MSRCKVVYFGRLMKGLQLIFFASDIRESKIDSINNEENHYSAGKNVPVELF